MTWQRVTGEHPGWRTEYEGRRYQLTDVAIRTYGRPHLERLLAHLPPLPNSAWDVPGTMSYQWKASWCETRPMAPNAAAAGAWNPAPWKQARDTLVRQLADNLDRWTRYDSKLRREYQAVLDKLRDASEPSARCLYLDLRDHSLALVRSEVTR